MAFDPLTLLVLKYHGRGVVVLREHCLRHEGLLAVARRTFPSLQDASAGDVVLVAYIPGSPSTEPVELLPEIWTTVCRVVDTVTIALRSETQSASGGTTACDSPVSSEMDLPGTTTTPSSSSSPPPPHPTPRLSSRHRARKPVIYLYPPSRIADVTVELTLVSSWRFSAVHPPPRTTVPPGEPQSAQSLTWTVAVEPNGTLVDKTSGMEVSYLYWEAIAGLQVATPGTSRASTPIADTETFDPARPSVNPDNSVLLPTSKVPGYLDVALKALALHTEARTSFITYWLPDMLKYEYIALRFLAQDTYERAAPMQITPAPDIVTRVFMLFHGVAVGDLRLWEAASTRAAATAADGARFWADVVGVDAARAANSGLFRVLEWGGMEVQ